MRRRVSASWFRGGLVFKAHRLLYHATLVLRVRKKKKCGCTGWTRNECGGEQAVQGYLTHEKQRPPRTLQQDYALFSRAEGLYRTDAKRVWGCAGECLRSSFDREVVSVSSNP